MVVRIRGCNITKSVMLHPPVILPIKSTTVLLQARNITPIPWADLQLCNFMAV